VVFTLAPRVANRLSGHPGAHLIEIAEALRVKDLDTPSLVRPRE
jgi:hypothetical protein